MASSQIDSVAQRKVCVITGTRAEYGHLQRLMQLIKDAADLDLQLLVTGMHLSPEFGNTYKVIEEDGFTIDWKVDICLESSEPTAICRSMGLAMDGFGQAFDALKPDVVVVLGDRFEILAATAAAAVSCIPVAHISGGERTEGAVDEYFRHAITKMAHLHFTSTEEYRQRVIQLGEKPKRVFNVGELTVDIIKHLELLDKGQLEQRLGRPLAKRNLLITFHPVTLEDNSRQQFRNILAALDQVDDTLLIFTRPNADAGGRELIAELDAYVADHADKAIVFTSMGQLFYLSALHYVDAVVGNSSSGITEAPSIPVATVNIGTRQQGRIRADSVIDCPAQTDSIVAALEHACSNDFKQRVAKTASPFGSGDTSEKILDILRKAELKGLLKKTFHDLPQK